MYYDAHCWKQLVTGINLQSALDFDDELASTCAVCGANRQGEEQFAYIYLYPPKAERMDLLVPTCDACLQVVTADVREHGSKLEDKNAQPSTSDLDAWGVPVRAA